MSKRFFGMSGLVVGALFLVCSAAFAASQASQATPPGEPTVPGRDVRLRARRAVSHDGGRAAQARRRRDRRDRRQARAGGGEGRQPRRARPPGKKVKPLKFRVGYLDIIGGIESADRAHNSLRVALTRLGATWIYCDGQGTPTKWVTCGNSLLAQNIDILALTGIDPSTIPAVVASAKAKNIPIVDFGGTVGPGFTAQFAPDEAKNGRILAAYLKAKLASQSSANIASIDYPAPWAQARTAQLKAMVAANQKFKITVNATTDPTNLIAGTQKTVSDALTADPSLKAIWVSFDTAGQAAGQVVASRYAGKKFPDKPLVVTFHADPSTQGLMKSGAIDVVVDNNYDATAWQLADAVAQFLARKKAFPKYGTSFKYPGIGDPLAYEIVTPKNLPKGKNKYVAPKVDVVTYFLAKWRAEGLIK